MPLGLFIAALLVATLSTLPVESVSEDGSVINTDLDLEWDSFGHLLSFLSAICLAAH